MELIQQYIIELIKKPPPTHDGAQLFIGSLDLSLIDIASIFILFYIKKEELSEFLKKKKPYMCSKPLWPPCTYLSKVEDIRGRLNS